MSIRVDLHFNIESWTFMQMRSNIAQTTDNPRTGFDRRLRRKRSRQKQNNLNLPLPVRDSNKGWWVSWVKLFCWFKCDSTLTQKIYCPTNDRSCNVQSVTVLLTEGCQWADRSFTVTAVIQSFFSFYRKRYSVAFFNYSNILSGWIPKSSHFKGKPASQVCSCGL